MLVGTCADQAQPFTPTYTPTYTPTLTPNVSQQPVPHSTQQPVPHSTPQSSSVTHHYHTIHGAMCVSHSGAHRVEIWSLDKRGVVDMQLSGYQQDWMSGLMIVDKKSIEFTLEAVDWYPLVTICAVDKSGSGPIIVLFIDEPTNLRTPTTNILAGLGMCLFLFAIFCLCAATLTRPVNGETLPHTIYDVQSGTSHNVPLGLSDSMSSSELKSAVSAFSAPPKSAI